MFLKSFDQDKFTFLFYDYETTGTHFALDKISQFACIRTDKNLNIIEKKNFYCSLPLDYLPNPISVLITGIYPDYLQKYGINEYFFAKKIHNIFCQPNTCIVGYNNISFDNIFTRYLLYRNLFDPYEWSWKNNNSTWDILNVLRTFYIFFPNELQWPKNNLGNISFKLEEIVKCNNIKNIYSHNADSDVLATIIITRMLIKIDKNLFFSLFLNSRKYKILQFLHKNKEKPVFLISSYFGSIYNNISCVVFIGFHPIEKNSIIIFDLRKNFINLLNVYLMDNRNYISITSLFSLGIHVVSINKSPIFLSYNDLTVQDCVRLNLDYLFFQKNFFIFLKNKNIIKWIILIFSNKSFSLPKKKNKNVDLMLYDNFLSTIDKKKIFILHQKNPNVWKKQTIIFSDVRLYQLLSRLYARNFFYLLNNIEKKKWKKYCLHKISHKILKKYHKKIIFLCETNKNNVDKIKLLNKLNIYSQQLLYRINNLI